MLDLERKLVTVKIWTNCRGLLYPFILHSAPRKTVLSGWPLLQPCNGCFTKVGDLKIHYFSQNSSSKIVKLTVYIWIPTPLPVPGYPTTATKSLFCLSSHLL